MNWDEYDCIRCFDALQAKAMATGDYLFPRMVLCPECGNKRCPKATDHRLNCTHSNESGQPGSDYA